MEQKKSEENEMGNALKTEGSPNHTGEITNYALEGTQINSESDENFNTQNNSQVKDSILQNSYIEGLPQN